MRQTFFVDAGTSQVIYVPIPAGFTKACLLGGTIVPDADNTTASTVTFTSGSTNVGVGTLTATTAGTPVAITMNSTLATRKTLFTSTVPLKITVSTQNATGLGICIDWDEYARLSE